MSVKRFDCVGCSTHCYGGYRMKAEDEGDYVKFDDYAALKEENERLWETLLKIGIYLDIDFEWARKQPGKPSDVFIGKIGAIKARVAELEAKESRLRNAVEKISANPYWESASRFAEGYWQRYNNVIRTADEALKEPDNEG